MKKYLFCLVTILSLSTVANAQHVDRLLRKVANAENVESIRVGNFLMSIARTAARASGNPIPRINSVEVFDLSASCTDFKQSLVNDFQQLKDGNGYETLMQVRDSGDDVRIMMKRDRRNDIRELVLFVINNNDPTVIRISGRITEDEITQLVSQHSR
jgi:hypothetical protein